MTEARQGRYAGARLDRRMSVAFGLLILAVMVVMAISVALFYQTLMRREENRLVTTLSSIIGQSIDHVSFSGRYHSQLLIEELQAGQPNITYIAIRKTDGTLLAKAGTPPAGDDAAPQPFPVGDGKAVIIDHEINGEQRKEVILPHRSGYNHAVTGTVHVVISFAELQAEMRGGLMTLLLLGLSLLGVAVVLTGRISRRLGSPARQMAEQLGGILDFAPLLIVIRDSAGTALDTSASYRALPPGAAAALLQPPASGRPVADGESVVRREVDIALDGGMRHFLVVEFAISRDRLGRPMQVCTIAADDTERRKAEAALRHRTQELERSNAELEQFAYIASHDLQEPLRMVSSYVALIERRYGSLLDQDGHDFIAYAKEGAGRMQRLILDLLDYSRIGRIGAAKTLVTMDEPLSAALSALRQSIEQSATQIDRPKTLPTVFGSSSELTRLWLNIIGNAIKYAHPDRRPHIRISVQRSNGEWVFSVRDNGIGIDAQYGERIFLIFQRLHPRDRYPGSGIGLSICQKIVNQHGGRIWLDPQEDGALFHFSLPVVESEAAHPTAAAADTG